MYSGCSSRIHSSWGKPGIWPNSAGTSSSVLVRSMPVTPLCSPGTHGCSRPDVHFCVADAAYGGSWVLLTLIVCHPLTGRLHSDIEVSELTQHLGIAARPPSPSRTLSALSGNERSRRDCSQLLPDELVVVPSQMDSPVSTPLP